MGIYNFTTYVNAFVVNCDLYIILGYTINTAPINYNIILDIYRYKKEKYVHPNINIKLTKIVYIYLQYNFYRNYVLAFFFFIFCENCFRTGSHANCKVES